MKWQIMFDMLYFWIYVWKKDGDRLKDTVGSLRQGPFASPGATNDKQADQGPQT